jgi:hypothetical protein
LLWLDEDQKEDLEAAQAVLVAEAVIVILGLVKEAGQGMAEAAAVEAEEAVNHK